MDFLLFIVGFCFDLKKKENKKGASSVKRIDYTVDAHERLQMHANKDHYGNFKRCIRT